MSLLVGVCAGATLAQAAQAPTPPDGKTFRPQLQTSMTTMRPQPRDPRGAQEPVFDDPNKPLILGTITTEAELAAAYPTRTDEGALAYAGMALDAGLKKKDLAGQTWGTAVEWRCQDSSRGGGEDEFFGPPPPTKVFDNVYYVGLAAVASWAIVGDNGDIIIIDTLYNENDVKTRILPGLQKFNLDPKRIKYILLTHGHADHTGGAPYLKSITGARIALGPRDWPTARPGQRAPALVKASDDISVEDGQEFTVGDTTVTAVLTPGHTQSTLSFVIDVKQNGVRHHAALWGGNGQPDDLSMLMTYRNSVAHFANYTDQAQVDVELSIHGDTDNFLPRLSQMSLLRPRDPNPFLVGRDAYVRYQAIYFNCVSALIAERIRWGHRVKLGAQQ